MYTPTWDTPVPEEVLNAPVSVPHVPIGTRMALPPQGIRFCVYVGKRRYQNNINAGVVEQKRSTKPGDVIAIEGVTAEYALLNMFKGTFYELYNCLPSSKYTDRGDAIINGVRIDVKGTRPCFSLAVYHSKNLENNGKENLIDLFAFYHRHRREYYDWLPEEQTEMEFRGFFPRAVLFARPTTPGPGGPNNHRASMEEMLTWEEALKALADIKKKRQASTTHCTECQQPLADSTRHTLPCGHEFHTACIQQRPDKWRGCAICLL